MFGKIRHQEIELLPASYHKNQSLKTGDCMDDTELLRYSRQIMVPEFDIQGQEALLNAKVVIVGLGGLGSAAALYLATSGVGHLVLVDGDKVDLSNLQRQIIHQNDRLGMAKVKSAKISLQDLNPEIKITVVEQYVTAVKTLSRIADKADVVLDATDNYAVRYVLNDYCLSYLCPLIFGAAIRVQGQLSTFDYRNSNSPCYYCLYGSQKEENTACADNGIMAPVVGVIGSMQAMEAIKIIAGIGQTLVGRLLVFDALTMQWQEFTVKQRKDCPVCSRRGDKID